MDLIETCNMLIAAGRDVEAREIWLTYVDEIEADRERLAREATELEHKRNAGMEGAILARDNWAGGSYF